MNSETVGRWQDWWPGSGAMTRAWDVFDRLESITGPDVALGTKSFQYDDLDRRTTVDTLHGDRFHGDEDPSAVLAEEIRGRVELNRPIRTGLKVCARHLETAIGNWGTGNCSRAG